MVVPLDHISWSVFFDFRGEIVKIFKLLVIGVFLFSIPCFAFNKNILISAVEKQDIVGILEFFDDIESISWEEARELVASFYDHYISQYGPELLNEEFEKKLEQCQSIYCSIIESKGISFESNLIRNSEDFSDSIVLCGKKKDKLYLEAEVPGSLILGGVEVVGGALVWILPIPGAKQLGGIMIGDGLRRTFNGLEELDEENKKNQGIYPVP